MNKKFDFENGINRSDLIQFISNDVSNDQFKIIVVGNDTKEYTKADLIQFISNSGINIHLTVSNNNLTSSLFSSLKSLSDDLSFALESSWLFNRRNDFDSSVSSVSSGTFDDNSKRQWKINRKMNWKESINRKQQNSMKKIDFLSKKHKNKWNLKYLLFYLIIFLLHIFRF